MTEREPRVGDVWRPRKAHRTAPDHRVLAVTDRAVKYSTYSGPITVWREAFLRDFTFVREVDHEPIL